METQNEKRNLGSMSWPSTTPQLLFCWNENTPRIFGVSGLVFWVSPLPPLSHPHPPGVSDGPRFVSDGPQGGDFQVHCFAMCTTGVILKYMFLLCLRLGWFSSTIFAMFTAGVIFKYLLLLFMFSYDFLWFHMVSYDFLWLPIIIRMVSSRNMPVILARRDLCCKHRLFWSFFSSAWS